MKGKVGKQGNYGTIHEQITNIGLQAASEVTQTRVKKVEAPVRQLIINPDLDTQALIQLRTKILQEPSLASMDFVLASRARQRQNVESEKV